MTGPFFFFVLCAVSLGSWVCSFEQNGSALSRDAFLQRLCGFVVPLEASTRYEETTQAVVLCASHSSWGLRHELCRVRFLLTERSRWA